jgi:GTP-binding protein
MIHRAVFVISNTDPDKCPDPVKPEIAMIGRSNVGKSSLINMLTNQKSLAKTSGTPGKTQLINHFIIDEKWYLVDLPGYGFAKVSKVLKADWDVMIKKYLTTRTNLAAVMVLIDSRLEPQKIDLEFITWCGELEVPFVLCFTKADKQSNSKTKGNVHQFIQASIKIFGEPPQYFITSAENKMGKQEVTAFMEELVNEFYQANK